MSEPLLTDDEHAAMAQAGALANTLGRIVSDGPQRAYDLAELVGSIHDVQARILAQAAARAYPERYRLLGGWPEVTTGGGQP